MNESLITGYKSETVEPNWKEILEAQKDVKCKKYFKQDLDLLRLYKMQTNYKLMESYVKTNKIFD